MAGFRAQRAAGRARLRREQRSGVRRTDAIGLLLLTLGWPGGGVLLGRVVAGGRRVVAAAVVSAVGVVLVDRLGWFLAPPVARIGVLFVLAGWRRVRV